jgi:hypothetical protein
MISEDIFLNRSFEEVIGGEYDEEGFYITPNGSFWDPDGVYFNKEGFDCHKGFYNNDKEYIPGPGWIEDLLCYEDEKDELTSLNISNKKKRKSNNEEGYYNSDKSADDDQPFEEVDYDKILAEEETKFGSLEIHTNVQSIKASGENNNLCHNLKELKVISSSIVPTELLFGPIPLKNTVDFSNDNLAVIELNKLDIQSDLTQKSRKEKQIEVDSLFL